MAVMGAAQGRGAARGPEVEAEPAALGHLLPRELSVSEASGEIKVGD